MLLLSFIESVSLKATDVAEVDRVSGAVVAPRRVKGARTRRKLD
jgi:hypothetical protein